ncbi:MAG: glycosyltransferase [Bacteroidetes bacterium]|nr:glycosyltransferase [Bacteroidota bacterium]
MEAGLRQAPVISVIMGVYNAETFLEEAIKSILNQSFRDFEFIIVNDASTDNSVAIINRFNDDRIRVINNESNIGLTRSLNKAIRQARGEFIARMDADDISFPDRFHEQVNFLKGHPAVALCGCQVFKTSKPGEGFPLDHEKIKALALASKPLAHPTVMWRRQAFIDNDLFYNESFRYAQDYELWSRALMKIKAANLPEHLFTYREHPGKIGNAKKDKQGAFAWQVKLSFLEYLHLHPTEREKELHACIFDDGFKNHRTPGDIKDAENWFRKILEANETYKIFDTEELLNSWARKVFCKGLYRYSPAIWVWSLGSVARKSSIVSSKHKAMFFIKCLLNKKNP